ncbi:MAG TPA: APC family permease, partial [Steroidobacteraceae bacterium]|nr:APC family permease [Steroidobacteraceae bacterium]
MPQGPSHRTPPQLVRVIGRWSMVALAINCMIGSGAFGLPSVVAGLVANLSPLAVLLAALAVAVVIGCYAEVASQFTETGGHYIYVRRAFGRFAGLQVGWLNLLGRLTACAAAANFLVISLGEFWPQADVPASRFAIVTLLIGTLAAANYRGVAAGTLVSNVSTVAKLVPLAVISVVGLGYLATHAAAAPPVPAAGGLDGWLKAMVLLFFLYGGFETALNPTGEARDPRRDAGFALFVALIVITFLYTALQLIVIRVLPDAADSARPLVDVA